jgi:hypothetical protein
MFNITLIETFHTSPDAVAFRATPIENGTAQPSMVVDPLIIADRVGINPALASHASLYAAVVGTPTGSPPQDRLAARRSELFCPEWTAVQCVISACAALPNNMAMATTRRRLMIDPFQLTLICSGREKRVQKSPITNWTGISATGETYGTIVQRALSRKSRRMEPK